MVEQCYAGCTTVNRLISKEMAMKKKTVVRGKNAPAKGSGADGVLTLTRLDQVSALADPLRVRMLGAFAEERTTRQVAEILHEKPTRLYHHLKALAAAGLIRETRTQRNRGTLETYYRAVAGAFRADPALFSSRRRSEASDSIAKAIDGMLDQTGSELHALIASESALATEEEPWVGFLELHGSESEMKKLRADVERLIERLQKVRPASARGRKAGPAKRYRLSILLFPLDLPGS
jgi:DNA-binding transcriptional ArsR family regulator